MLNVSPDLFNERNRHHLSLNSSEYLEMGSSPFPTGTGPR
jgi:hypothetical protein